MNPNVLSSYHSNILPRHVAFIVDGNRRWARKRGLPAIAGHKFVVEELLDKLIDHAYRKGIKYLTFWVFSTENWKRGQLFSRALFSLLKKGINQKAAGYVQKGYKFAVIGDLTALSKDLVDLLLTWQKRSTNNKKITVTIAINYGGRDEIIRAIKKVSKLQSFKVAELTKDNFSKFLDTAGMPDPDMIIRTGGEKRLSGFLLWQSEYSELYFTDILFPDFTPQEFDKALAWYSQRERRFGK
jgi:undecaprenyl diphosphate synthase